jgi:allophanate hydrolase
MSIISAHPARPPAPPRLLGDWLALQPQALLKALQDARGRAVAGEPKAAWLHTCPADAWAAQLRLLLTRLDDDDATRAQRWPLLGVPFAVKDNIDIAGQPTTPPARPSASPGRRQRHRGAAPARCRCAVAGQDQPRPVRHRPGGHPIALWPAGACVDDDTRISGGSSSGSAVAVARRRRALCTGHRHRRLGPRAGGFNGLVGLKPTPGRVSTAGVLPACRSLDCVSVFAHSVDDAATRAGGDRRPDAADAYSAFAPGPARLPLHLAHRRAGHTRAGCHLGYDRPGRRRCSACARRVKNWCPSTWHRCTPWRRCSTRPLGGRTPCRGAGPAGDRPRGLDPTVRRVIGRALDFSATDTFRGAVPAA